MTASQCTHTHTHPFNSPFSRTTRVGRYQRLVTLCEFIGAIWISLSIYQKGKPNWILLQQETVSGSGISWAICKSAPRSRQIITPAPHHSVFYRPDALPAAQPTVSKHWRLHHKRPVRWMHYLRLHTLCNSAWVVFLFLRQVPCVFVTVILCTYNR